MKKLENIPKKDNFKTPENYFENLEVEIIEKSKLLETGNKRISGIDVLKPYLYLAASIVIMVLIMKAGTKLFMNKPNPEKVPVATTEVAKTDSDRIAELSDDDLTLYEYLTEEETIADSEIVTDENYEYIGEYLADDYLEYELINE
jgi:hypothetical protein